MWDRYIEFYVWLIEVFKSYGSLAVLTWLFTLLAVVLIAAPLYRYITLGWRLKMDAITNEFDPPAIALYFRKYRTSERTGDNKRCLKALKVGLDDDILSSEFARLYCREFGRGKYILPLGILLIVTLIEAAAAIQSGLFHARSEDLFLLFCSEISKTAACPAEGYKQGLTVLYNQLISKTLLLDATTVAGLVGAYMWVVQDGITRMRSRDLLPSNIYWSALRMAIAAPLGIAIASVASESAGPFVAFGGGAFPIEQLLRFIRTLTAKKLGVTEDPDTDGDEVKKLVGVNNDVAQRLIAENSSTVLQLAKADPVWLTMRTNLPLDVVAELIDQAIVWLNFAAARADNTARKMECLRASNLASATRVAEFVDLLKTGSPQADNAKDLLVITAKTLELDKGKSKTNYHEAQLSRIFTSIADDEATKFLVKLKALNAPAPPSGRQSTGPSGV